MGRVAGKVKTFATYTVDVPHLTIPISRIEISEMTRTDTSSGLSRGQG
jgi:hypothetical protein